MIKEAEKLGSDKAMSLLTKNDIPAGIWILQIRDKIPPQPDHNIYLFVVFYIPIGIFFFSRRNKTKKRRFKGRRGIMREYVY